MTLVLVVGLTRTGLARIFESVINDRASCLPHTGLNLPLQCRLITRRLRGVAVYATVLETYLLGLPHDHAADYHLILVNYYLHSYM